MIFRDMATHDLYIVCITDLSDEIADSGTNTSRQNRFMVFSGPDEMVLKSKIICDVWRYSFTLVVITLKESPKGEKFAPKDGYETLKPLNEWFNIFT